MEAQRIVELRAFAGSETDDPQNGAIRNPNRPILQSTKNPPRRAGGRVFSTY
jgi:hypothetical protein